MRMGLDCPVINSEAGMQELNARDLLLRYFLYTSRDKGWIDTDRGSSAYRYLPNGIKKFPMAEEFAPESASMGFKDIGFQRLTIGIVAIHTARKPQPREFDSHHRA
jgi:ubiquinone/menaquinone biosynthesis C-methylase UbiE